MDEFQTMKTTNHLVNQFMKMVKLPTYAIAIKAEAKAIRDAGLPASVSNTAGTYVCNHIMYQVQYMRDKEFPNIKAGFIHIPFLPEQVVNRPSTPSMALDDIVKGLTAALSAIVDRDGKGDIEAVEGANH